MDHITKELSLMGLHMETGDTFLVEEATMRGKLDIMQQKEKELWLISKTNHIATLDSGQMICQMVKENKNGPMDLFIEENFWTVQNMEKEFITSMMDNHTMKDILSMICFMEKVNYQ